MKISSSWIGVAALLSASACAVEERQPAVSDTIASTATRLSADSMRRVSPLGLGPHRFGTRMGIDSAGCAYIRVLGDPAGMRLMVEHGILVRVDVDSGTVATEAGARIGDSEARIAELYGRRVAAGPHKYDPAGHTLTVVPAAKDDTLYRLVFETDGKRVTRYHAGLLPAAAYVEGCG
jgi:hypothetical protein